MWKVYEIHLKPYEQSIFYLTEPNGILRNICDKKYPRPSVCSSLWNKDGSWTQFPKTDILTISIPLWLVNRDEEYDCFKEQLHTYLKSYHSNDNFKNYNMFLVIKHGEQFNEIGTMLYDANGLKRNREMESFLKKIIKCEVFS